MQQIKFPPKLRSDKKHHLNEYDSSGQLAIALHTLLLHWNDPENAQPTEAQILLIRNYFKQYLKEDCWRLQYLKNAYALLRASIDKIYTADDIASWVGNCWEVGLDPI